MSNQAKAEFQGKLSMKVIRKDGTVEHHETDWSSLGEEQKKHMLSIPSFREWFRKQNKED